MKAKGLADGNVGPGFKAALGQLLTRLKKEAVRGVVPEPVFLDRVRGLGIDLTDKQLHGLRLELSRLGLRIERKDALVEEDPAAVPMVVGGAEFSGADVVRALLERYRDEQGRVSDLALEGITRLAGLNEREAGVVWRAEREQARPATMDAPTVAELVAEPIPEPKAPADPAGTGGSPVDVTAAVAAARARLGDDRFLKRPDQRILTAEEEVGLSVLLRGGVEGIAVEPRETELAKLSSTDVRRAAYECLVLHNQRLVHKIALMHGGQGLDHEDLFQHGVRGVLRAAVKFDPLSGNKFSTYATWWIRQCVTRAVADEGRLIRVPVHFHEVMRKVANVERSRASQGLPTRDADLAVACDLPLSKVEEVRRISVRTDSLDRVLLDGATLGDLVASTYTVPSVERQVLMKLLHVDVMAVVDSFPEREARILVRRMELDGDGASTLDELGAEFGVTRERIRQLFNKTHPVFMERLREAGVIGSEREQEERDMRLKQEADRRAAQNRAESLYMAQRQANHQIRAVRADAERRIREAEERAQAAEDRARAAEEAGAVQVDPAPAAGGAPAETPQVATVTSTARAEEIVAEAEAAREAAEAELEALRRAVAKKEDAAVAEVAQRAFVAQAQAEADARAARAEAEAQARAERAEAEAQARVARAQAEVRAQVEAAEEQTRAVRAQAEEQVRAVRAQAETEVHACVAQVEAGRTPHITAAGDRRLVLAGARHRVHTALLRREHQLRLAAVAAGWQQAVDAEVRVWERAFLDRMDRALAHGEQSLRAEFAQRIEQMTRAHRETEGILLRRAQRAEAELVAAEAASADTVHVRRQADEAQRQLRQHLAECGQRVAGLEQRLRDAETSFAQQHRYTRQLEQSLVQRQGEAQQAKEAEQRLMERLAQNEWAFRAQIDQLRVQLDAARVDAEARRTLRDRWRRD